MDGHLIRLPNLSMRSIHGEDPNICVGSLITYCRPDCCEIFPIALPFIVVVSFFHQLFDFALKSPRSTTKKGLFCTADSRFSPRFSLKDSN